MGLSYQQLTSLMQLSHALSKLTEASPAPCVLEAERRHLEARERVLRPRVREMLDKGWIEWGYYD